jgi:hypothetical protein
VAHADRQAPFDSDLRYEGARPFGVVSGTVRFDTREQATFTGPGGGTMPLFRQDNGPQSADCDASEPPIPFAPVPGRLGFDSPLHVAVVTDERRDDGSQPLIPATIQTHEGHGLILDFVAPHGVAQFGLPSMVLTVTAQVPGRGVLDGHRLRRRTTGGAHPDFVRLTCPAG